MSIVGVSASIKGYRLKAGKLRVLNCYPEAMTKEPLAITAAFVTGIAIGWQLVTANSLRQATGKQMTRSQRTG